MAKTLQFLCKISSIIVLLCVLTAFLYWTLAAIKVGHFPTYTTNLKWRPFPVFREVVEYSLVVSLFSLLILCMTNLVALLKKDWYFKKQLYSFGITAILLFTLLWVSDFWNWFLD